MNSFGYSYGKPMPVPCGICKTALERRDPVETISKARARDGFTRTAVSLHREYWCPKCEKVTAIGPG